MKLLAKIILQNLLGWTITNSLIGINKSVIIFAPHTSYWDGFYGKLFFLSTDIKYSFLSKKEFFIFPLNIFFKAFGSIPVEKEKGYVDYISELFNNNNHLHIVLSPEGQLAKTDHWKKGFYYMAKAANVPIVLGYIDYKKKELGIKQVILDIDDMNKTMKIVANVYKDINAKYPLQFTIDKRYN